VFTAPTPPQAGTEKYAPSVGVTAALLRYGSGMPHYRLARLQQSLGVPLPESTQWEVMKPLFEQAQPIFEQMIAQAANSPLIHQDDTTMRILDLRRPGSATAAQMDPQRKGTFTSNLPLLYRMAARRGEPGPGVASTCSPPGAADPNVRCLVAEQEPGL
jgi:transposase